MNDNTTASILPFLTRTVGNRACKRTTKSLPWRALLAALPTATTLAAQSPIDILRGAENDRLGTAVAALGDIDGDGVPDFAVGAPRHGLTTPERGRVAVVRGSTGMPLREIASPALGDGFGHAMRRCGDVDRDGTEDFIVGAPLDDTVASDAGAAYVCSGSTGAFLFTFLPDSTGGQFGYSVSGAGDTNGDGWPDLLVGAPYAAGQGRAYLFSGRDGALLFTFAPDLGDELFGWCVRELDDADGDTFADFMISAPRGRTWVNHDLTGYVRVMSGRTGLPLWHFFGTSVLAQQGQSIAPCADLDNDGRRDVLVGAPGLSPSGGASGAVLAYSSQTGAFLRSFPGGRAGDRLGGVVSGLGDVDGDGHGDLLLCEGRTSGGVGRALVYSSMSGQLLGIVPRLSFDLAIIAADDPGDVDGDGVADLLIGVTSSYNLADRGAAHLVSVVTRPLSADLPSVRVTRSDVVRLTLSAGSAHAGKVYLLAGSLSGTRPGLPLGPVTLPLNFDAYLMLLAGSPNGLIANSMGVLDANGAATATFSGVNLPSAAAGVLAHHAYLVFTPGFAGFDLASNAVPMTWMPR